MFSISASEGVRAVARRLRMKLLRSGASDQYWHYRSDSLYFQYVDFLVRVVGRDAQSILDVGSNSSPYLEWFNWIPYKLSIDINAPYHSRRVHGKKIDFLEYKNNRDFDICLSLQVLEHIHDAKSFAQKLLKIGHHVIVCVPYRWPAGTNSNHVHDPVGRCSSCSILLSIVCT
jgi:hypothetical protein